MRTKKKARKLYAHLQKKLIERMTNKKIWTWQQRILLKIETAIYFKSM